MSALKTNQLPKVKVEMCLSGNVIVEDKPYNCRALSVVLSYQEAHRIARLYNNPATHEQGVAALATVAIKKQ